MRALSDDAPSEASGDGSAQGFYEDAIGRAGGSGAHVHSDVPDLVDRDMSLSNVKTDVVRRVRIFQT
ncbi:hypothetical protein MACH18_29990 [Phaeobacter italicus]|nr:hypothetical protein MACH18_29990 [Phaeobacter italicus]